MFRAPGRIFPAYGQSQLEPPNPRILISFTTVTQGQLRRSQAGGGFLICWRQEAEVVSSFQKRRCESKKLCFRCSENTPFTSPPWGFEGRGSDPIGRYLGGWGAEPIGGAFSCFGAALDLRGFLSSSHSRPALSIAQMLSY